MLERGTRESEQRHGIPTVFVIQKSKSEWLLLFARRILVFERDRIRDYSFESGNNGQGGRNGFWCIMIECLSGNTKFSLRIKNYPRGQLQKIVPHHESTLLYNIP